jgi:hypothetical protein
MMPVHIPTLKDAAAYIVGTRIAQTIKLQAKAWMIRVSFPAEVGIFSLPPCPDWF